MLKNKEHHLFILWDNARNFEQEILVEIKSTFKILKKVEIQWDEDKFIDNLSSFYGFDHSGRFDILNERGHKEFLVVIVQDENPKYIEVDTSKGKVWVNKNMFEMKWELRKKYFNGKYLVHTTNNIEETKHDICLLLGKSLADLEKENFFDGTYCKIKQNLPAVDGWKSQEHIFYILNETVNYVIIRDIDNAPFSLPFPDFPNSGCYYYDYEILTDDSQSLRYILSPKDRMNGNEFSFGTFIDLQGKVQPFHIKYLGDRYFDINIEKKLLDTKKKNKNGVWVIGNDEYYFFTLLYHGIIHKENYEKYDVIFTKIAPKIGINDYKCDLRYLSNLLYAWMKKNNYNYFQPIDMPDRIIKYNNIPHNDLIYKKPELFIFQDNLNTIVFNSNFIVKNPKYATSYIKFMQPYIKIHEHILDTDNKLYSKYGK